MKKSIPIFLLMIILFSFCSCNKSQNMIGTKSGMAYFKKYEDISEITCSYKKGTQIKLDETFVDKLRDIINGKQAGSEFCNCKGDYQVMIDNKYLFYLHSDKIVVYTNLEDHSGFTVTCSAQETQILYDIIESRK